MDNMGEVRKYEFDNMKQDTSYPAWIQHIASGTGPHITDAYTWEGNKPMAKGIGLAVALQGLLGMTGKAINNAGETPSIPKNQTKNTKSPEIAVELTPNQQRGIRLKEWLETGNTNDPHLNGNDQGIAQFTAKLYSDATGRSIVQSPVTAKKGDWIRAYVENQPEIDAWYESTNKPKGRGPGAASIDDPNFIKQSPPGQIAKVAGKLEKQANKLSNSAQDATVERIRNTSPKIAEDINRLEQQQAMQNKQYVPKKVTKEQIAEGMFKQEHIDNPLLPETFSSPRDLENLDSATRNQGGSALVDVKALIKQLSRDEFKATDLDLARQAHNKIGQYEVKMGKTLSPEEIALSKLAKKKIEKMIKLFEGKANLD